MFVVSFVNNSVSPFTDFLNEAKSRPTELLLFSQLLDLNVTLILQIILNGNLAVRNID